MLKLPNQIIMQKITFQTLTTTMSTYSVKIREKGISQELSEMITINGTALDET